MKTNRKASLFAAVLSTIIAVATVGIVRADPLITEFLASNKTVLADEDGTFSDWIELYNPDATPVNLAGWFLTDTAKTKAKWQLPAVTLPAQGFLVVFASGKDRRDPSRPLHTNFSLEADGEYLALIRPDGVTATTEFSPAFPDQREDVSFGVVSPNTSGAGAISYLQAPTPGTRNSGAKSASLAETVSFSPSAGPFTEVFTLTISGAGAGQHIRYMLVAPSAAGAAAPELNATSPRYTGPIVISSSVVVKAAVFSTNDTAQGASTSTQFVKIGGPSAAQLLNFSSVLPVLVLDDHGAGALEKDGVDHEGWLFSYSSRSKGTSFLATGPDIATPVAMSVRGSSSAAFPKKGYSLDLSDAMGGKNELPLAGSVPAKKWTLIGPWYFDPTFIKNSFIYTLSNRIGRWAPGTQPVELFFNSSGDLGGTDYAGIYVVTDKIEIDSERVNITPLSSGNSSASDVTGGYILKLDSPDADEFSWKTTRNIPSGSSAVVVASAKATELAPAQRDYIRTYVQQMEDALDADYQRGFATRTYLDYIDRPSWVDHHILNVFASNFDALERSAYITKDRGGKLVAGPIWDFDRAFGSATYFATTAPNVWHNPEGVDFWEAGWWGYIARDPEFMQEWVDRWQSLRKDVFANANLTALADSLAATIGTDALARDAARWPLSDARFAPGVTGGVASMKSWFTTRVAWIDNQFVTTPTVTDGGATLTFRPAAGSQLAYTLDGSDPRSLGGRIAPNAQLTSAPLTVPATANVHVRGYRADREGVFPGSPWSSAVGGANSSPLYPAARLVNISARALVGTGENALIAGVVVSDTAQKSYLVRGVGPTLAAFGANNVLPDPELSIRRSDGVEIYRNTGWQYGADAAALPNIARSVGAFPLATASNDSALLPEVSSGLYTVRVSSPTGQTGVGLAELYETGTNGRTTNLSARANVQPGEGSLIGGFFIQGPAYKRVLIRGIGPTLRVFGVTNALEDPIITIYSGQTAIATNDKWSASSDTAAITAASGTVGAFVLASGSEDAALLITLPPGAYTAEVRGKNATSGVALLEIYEVP